MEVALKVSIIEKALHFRVSKKMTEELCGDQGVQSILTLSLPECLMEFCKVTLTFESVDEIV